MASFVKLWKPLPAKVESLKSCALFSEGPLGFRLYRVVQIDEWGALGFKGIRPEAGCFFEVKHFGILGR